MRVSKYILISTVLFITVSVSAQKAERDYIRKGNRLFADSVFVDAEISYRKALEVNPASTSSMYNLGNTLSQQQKFEESMEQYVSATKIEKDKMKLASTYHNMGVIFQAAQDYAKAIEAYKFSLRNNPKDDETRYNLALAQKLLKDQKQDQEQKDDQNQSEDQKKEDDQKEKEKQQDEDKKDQQKPSNPEKKENEMSKENAEQLLKSVMQDEKNTQDKVQRKQVMQGVRLEKDW